MKNHALAFRRWIAGKSPSKKLVSKLQVKSRDSYLRFFNQFFESDPWTSYPDKWHIDHICPLCLFNESEIGLAWSQENLRPLDKVANKLKGGSLYEALNEINKRLSNAPDNINLNLLREKLTSKMEEEDKRIIYYT